MPDMFEQICKEFNLEIEAESSCFSGVNLETHVNTYWYKKTGFHVDNPPNNSILSRKYKVDTNEVITPTTIDKILEVNYKYIFLQEQPNYILNAELREKSTKPSLKIIDSLANRSNSKIFLAQTYTGKSDEKACLKIKECQNGDCNDKYYCSDDFQSFEEKTDTLVRIYNNVALEFGFRTIPIAEVFEHFRKNQPQIELYKQGSHPTKNGSFIMACIHYFSITNQKDFTKMEFNPVRKDFDVITKELLVFFSK